MANYPRVKHPYATPITEYCYPIISVRLACLIHAASVRSEPESNSPFKLFFDHQNRFQIGFSLPKQYQTQPFPSFLGARLITSNCALQRSSRALTHRTLHISTNRLSLRLINISVKSLNSTQPATRFPVLSSSQGQKRRR